MGSHSSNNSAIDPVGVRTRDEDLADARIKRRRNLRSRIAIGPRDLENNTIEIARRDTLEKEILHQDNLAVKVEHLLEQIQENLYQKALDFREENIHYADTYEEFKQILEEKGGFIYAHWDGTPETEEKIKEETKATIRCIPLDAKEEEGKCIYTGKPSKRRVIFAKAY